MIIRIRDTEIKTGFPFFVLITYFLSTDMCENFLWAMLFATLHESGHAIAMTLFGARPRKFVFGITGIRLDKQNESVLSFRHEILTAAAGPAINLIFALIFLIADVKMPFYVNAGLLIINMLPVRNLDGGRIIYYSMMMKCDELYAEKALNISELLTLTILCVILAHSVIMNFVNTTFVMFSVGLAGMIVINAVRNRKLTS